MISICMLALIASRFFVRLRRTVEQNCPRCPPADMLDGGTVEHAGGMTAMDRWLTAALDYIPSWLEFQMRQSEQPGCAIAIAQRGRIVLERAFGHADLVAGTKLTPRHRFRVASHSKSFTASGIMK